MYTHAGGSIWYVVEHGTPAECQMQSTYRHDNAFVDIYMGEHDQGIHLVAGPDTMHATESGTTPLIIDLTNIALVPTSLQAFDEFGKGFGVQIKQQITKTFPRMSFVHGLTTTTCLSSSEKVDTLFLYTVPLVFPEVHARMAAGFAAKVDPTYHAMKPELVRDAME